MRTIKIDKEKDFENAFEKGLKVLRDADKFDGISKEEAFEKYGIEIYPSGKRKSQTEYNIQAKFINYLLENDFKLATSEFAITRGENSRMDIIAEKDGNLWIFEVKDKDYKTDALKQVNGYKQLLEANKKVIRDILLPVIPDLKEDFTIHTALVYTGNERSQIGIDAAWRYENGTFIKVE